MRNLKGKLLLSLMMLPVLGVSNASTDEQIVEESTVVEVVSDAKPVVEKTIYGHDEKVILPQLNDLVVKTKLDTGAATASLNALDLKIFTKKKEKWVRFQLESGKRYYEFPIKRMSRIKKRSGEIDNAGEATFAERPVIELDVCLGEQKKKLEVNLTDRSRFTFPFLIGRIGLVKLKAIVDPSVSKTTTSVCPTTK